MNYGISILFRAIPLAMALFCYFYGGYIFLAGDDSSRLIAGPVVFFLGSICVALYATAATIIGQIIHRYNTWLKYSLPILGYLFAVGTFIAGVIIINNTSHAEYFVSGHVICGLGLIAACVSTAATASTRFSLIPQNSASSSTDLNPKGFTATQEVVMESVIVLLSIVAWIWAFYLLWWSQEAPYIVAGSVMLGIACVCSSLLALVASITRQARNNYQDSEKRLWVSLVVFMGLVAFVWGVIQILVTLGDPNDFIGFILIGLSLICFSISSKVLLLAKIWKGEYALASRIPIIPVMTALACLFLAAFLFEEAYFKTKFFVPARVITAFGAVCFTLFSIVSILESGAKKS